MTEPEPVDQLTAAEQELAARLEQQRPVPAAGFRGALGRHLAATDPGYGPRPGRLWLIVSAWFAAGLCLIAVATAIATGAL